MPESLPGRSWKPLTRGEIAVRTAADIPEGWYVNLGIGIPTMIADYIPANREVVLHSENGLVGMGPAPPPDRINRWLVNAGKQNVTMVVGGSFVDQAASFGIIRGGHLDLCVLGAFEVAENGDLANWATSLNDTAPGVGGAMDLAVGARRLWVVMEHMTKAGEPRLKRKCTYPLTARGVVSRIYTNLAVVEITSAGFRVVEMVPGLTLGELQTMTDAPLSM